MKRAIAIITLSALLLAGGIIELILVNNILNDLNKNISVLETAITDNEEDITLVKDELDKVIDHWHNFEQTLSLMFNHKDLGSITDSINRLQANVETNNYDDAIVELTLLKWYSENSKYVMSYNMQNIF